MSYSYNSIYQHRQLIRYNLRNDFSFINDYIQIQIQHFLSIYIIIIMEKAHTFERHCKFVKDLMQMDQYKGKQQHQVDKILQNRINKFYATNDFIQVDEEHFKPRLQPFYMKGIEPSNDTLVLFGIDFMKKQQLKQYFEGFNPEFYFIDQSNCILSFQSPEATLAAIRLNAKPDSSTRFKVEEDLDQEFLTSYNISLGKGKQPKEWIELKPYIYRYKQRGSGFKQFERKLYIRYATTREKEAGFDKISFIDGMINKCKAIWENEAKKDQNFRLFLQNKMIQLQEKKRKMQQTYQNNRDSRSRSRQKSLKTKNSPNELNTKANRIQGVQEDLSFQIQSRSSNTQFNHLIDQLNNLNICVEQKSIIGHIDTLKGKDNTATSGAPEIAYKLAQPSQLRVEFKNDKFNYKKYIQQSLQKEEKKQMMSYFDLTLDD